MAKVGVEKSEGGQWLSRDDSDYLALLRAVSIFVIVFGHVGGFWVFPPWSEFLQVFVPVFFFISGAVSYNSFLKAPRAGQYLGRRLVGILIPYYCLCVLALAVYLVINRSLPDFSFVKLVKWLAIIPSNAMMPFPVGQVWFLHTLAVLFAVSPLVFLLYRGSAVGFGVLMGLSVCLSVVQLKINLGPSLIFAGNDLFKPIVHALFFCVGVLVIDRRYWRTPVISASIVATLVAISVALIKGLELNPDYAQHTIFPDFYYVAGSLAAIWLALLCQRQVLGWYRASPVVIHAVVNFLFRHTFAIFLLHTFAIFLVEKLVGLENPQQKTIVYGVGKLLGVLAITVSMAPAFSKASEYLMCWVFPAGESSKKRMV